MVLWEWWRVPLGPARFEHEWTKTEFEVPQTTQVVISSSALRLPGGGKGSDDVSKNVGGTGRPGFVTLVTGARRVLVWARTVVPSDSDLSAPPCRCYLSVGGGTGDDLGEDTGVS